MMSLTLVCVYIIIGLCFLLFVNYKFLKIFITSPNKYSRDANSNNANVSNKNTTSTATINNNNNLKSTHYEHLQMQSMNNLWSIPGPLSLPFLGTKWIYLWKYKMSKIHEVYQGNINNIVFYIFFY